MRKNIESLQAAKDFLQRGKSQRCIVSFSGFGEIPSLSNKVDVRVIDYNGMGYNVIIDWEDEPYELEDYKEYGLFGYYATNFCKMEYDETSNTLTITDSNRKKIMLTY